MVLAVEEGLNTTAGRDHQGVRDMTGGLRTPVDSVISISDEAAVRWQFKGSQAKKRMTVQVISADILVGRRLGSHLGPLDYTGTLEPGGPLSVGESNTSRSITWTTQPPVERRLQSAIELDRAEIGFDETAAGILGRFYDLGYASITDLADWIQSPEQWIAFSRLQRSRYVDDLGSQFTLSRDGREFVEEMLAQDNTE